MGTITRSIANNIVTGGKIDGTDGLNGVIPASNINNNSFSSITALSPSLGLTITSVASDPPAPSEGQMWYNTTTSALKGYQSVVTNSWASGGNVNTARYFNAGLQVGTQTAALIFGGFPGPVNTASESYNGTSWTNTPNLASGKSAITGFGTQTAALGAGGTPAPGTTTVQSWNGSSWTIGTSMGTARYGALSAGIQTAGLVFGSAYGSNTVTEEWDGTSWTTGGSVNTTPVSGGGSAGIQTAAILFGGGGPPMLNRTEYYNGTSWTTVPGTLNTSRGAHIGGAGTQTSALAFGGDTNVFTATPATELWNGSTWTSNPTGLATARSRLAGNGTQAAALASTGFNNTTQVANTEEWTGTALATRTITVS
jgi:hypothetical protein